MVTDDRLTGEELACINEQIQTNWPTGEAIDFEEAVAFHEQLPDHKQFTHVLHQADDQPLLQPRAGVPCLDDQIELLEHLRTAGGADLLPTTIDSYTRDNRYEDAQAGLEEARESGEDTLNGFPAVNHGVSGCRELVESVDAPIQVRHGTPDARLLAAVTLAGGMQSFEGGPITYNVPYTSKYSLEETIRYWQYVDRLAGAYTERGVTINREPFGPLTGTLVPPSISIAICIIEGLIAATQGVRSITLGYGQVGDIVQDVAALEAMRTLGEAYLPNEVQVTTVFHEWMGGFPADEARAYGVISVGGVTAAIANPDKIITKSPEEAIGVPTAEGNAAGLRTTRQAMEMIVEQDIRLEGIEREREIIEQSTRSLLDRAYEIGDGDIVRGTIQAFADGLLDVPFSPGDVAAGDILPARDDDGRVRLLKFGNLAFDEEIKEIHHARLEERAQAENRNASFRMAADDVAAISDGALIGRPESTDTES